MSWDVRRAEEHMLSLELFGMRFGLERMRRLLTVLGSPQERFRAVHVVGTNGKSSTVRFTAALLEAHGVKTGAYLSPHLTTFAERIRVGDRDLTASEFAGAIERAATAAAKVDRTSPDGERVTQFELLTAAAFDELARHGVEVAVIEAGLGGRYDATNVLGAEVVVLTNVGLEHTRWLGPTIPDIAGEKLAVVRPGATLVLGDDDPDVLALALATGAEIVRPASVGVDAPGYQRLNLGAAVAAAKAVLGTPLDAAPISLAVPGRLQVVAHDPLTIYDGAHNAPGIAALAESVPEGTVAVIAVLDDKDAAAMLKALLPRLSAAVFTRVPNPRALSPATLADLAAKVGSTVPSEIEPDPRKAVSRAREIAGEHGTVLATGSIYLVADLLSAPGTRRASAL
ncbi:Mur ligase family protein [Solirubrobacter phytolaccae]|uniref:tetrahydrofolate synthase n=1 Tax=Solirubrobacter phytolaccae TaxID=1404360 RepID=A0A9X3SBB6_9ACTN|nr:Mur ligase family protein [Solirubrobacter phytolaccae]MDA0181220.1 Mur ligase family protein [Solirubrobacter phytolaccae]